MQRSVWIALVVLLPAMGGCLGDVEPAQISQETLNNENWEQVSSEEQSLAMGLATLVTNDYRCASACGGGSLGGADVQTSGVIVASTNDVPILDERRFIPAAIEKVEEERNINLEESGNTMLSLPNLGEDVNATTYTFTKSGVNGKAVLFTPDCSSFVVTVGYGVVQDSIYEDAKNIARQVTC